MSLSQAVWGVYTIQLYITVFPAWNLLLFFLFSSACFIFSEPWLSLSSMPWNTDLIKLK